MVNLHVVTPHKRKMDIRLSQSKLVEDLIADAGLLGKNAHAYYQGTKLRVGRRLSEYKLPDRARIEMRRYQSPPALISTSASFQVLTKQTQGWKGPC